VFFPIIPKGFYFSDIYSSVIAEEKEMQRFMFALLYTAGVFVIIYRMAKVCIERRLEHA